MQSLAKIDGTTGLVLEYSYKPTPDELGTHGWTMELFWEKGDLKNGDGLIEWDIPGLDNTEHIGIWVEDGELSDYDGLMSLPSEAIKLLESVGIVVGEEYRD